MLSIETESDSSEDLLVSAVAESSSAQDLLVSAVAESSSAQDLLVSVAAESNSAQDLLVSVAAESSSAQDLLVSVAAESRSYPSFIGFGRDRKQVCRRFGVIIIIIKQEAFKLLFNKCTKKGANITFAPLIMCL